MILEYFAGHLTVSRALEEVFEGTENKRRGLGACLSSPKLFTGIKEEKDCTETFGIRRH